MTGNVLDSSPRPPIVDTSRSPHARLRPLPLDAVKPRRRFLGAKEAHQSGVTAVPYAWANRELGTMRVWLGNG